MNLSGKVLVITGSNGALGQAAAETLSGYGATLALLDHAQTPSTAPPGSVMRLISPSSWKRSAGSGSPVSASSITTW